MKKALVTQLIAIGLFAANFVTAGTRLTFTERLRKKPAIVLKQDKLIDLLVDGREPESPKAEHEKSAPHNTVVPHDKLVETTVKTQTKTERTAVSKTTTKQPTTSSKGFHYAQGYRLKFFTGSGTRQGKETAQQKGKEFKKHFPQVSVYMHFVSPNWICTAGDFATQAEVYDFIKEVKKDVTIRTSEMSVVRSKVKIFDK